MQGRRTVLGGLTKFDDALQLANEKFSLQIKSSFIRRAAKIRRFHDEIINYRAALVGFLRATE